MDYGQFILTPEINDALRTIPRKIVVKRIYMGTGQLFTPC